MTVTDNDLDARLRAAHAGNPVFPSGAVSLLVRETRERTHRRRTRVMFGTGAAIAVLGIGAVTAGPAVADTVRQFLAQSGWTSTGSEVIEDSEFIDTGAKDVTEYIDTIFPSSLPLAPGQTRAGVIATVVDLQTPALRQEVGLRRDIERQIRLGWLSEWIDANTTGDQARMDAAVRVLVDSTTWPAFIATDGGGVVVRDAAFMTAIANGNADAAQAFAQYDDAPLWDGVDRTAVIDGILASVENGE